MCEHNCNVDGWDAGDYPMCRTKEPGDISQDPEKLVKHIDPIRKVSQLELRIIQLERIILEVHSWAVCATITTPEDMAQNFPRIIEITSPEYEET